jgi:hypothetical protein
VEYRIKGVVMSRKNRKKNPPIPFFSFYKVFNDQKHVADLSEGLFRKPTFQKYFAGLIPEQLHPETKLQEMKY